MKPLSVRQAEVVALLLAGASQKEIAHLLKVSDKTVHTHTAIARRRLGVPLIAFALHYPDQARTLYARGNALLSGGARADAS